VRINELPCCFDNGLLRRFSVVEPNGLLASAPADQNRTAYDHGNAQPYERHVSGGDPTSIWCRLLLLLFLLAFVLLLFDLCYLTGAS
jgi:hypothetical protein